MQKQLSFLDHHSPSPALSAEHPLPDPELGQYFTPFWAAQMLINRYYAGLSAQDTVFDVGCGHGPFLAAIPKHVRAIGIDIDSRLASSARHTTGRDVIVGDFLQLQFDVQPTVIVSNPPFTLETIRAFLDRSQQLLPPDGRVGMLLPAYAFQTARTVAELANNWSISQALVPRNLFAGLSLPLVFAQFVKDKKRVLIGFTLYDELADLQSLHKPFGQIIGQPHASAWKQAVTHALKLLGGKGTLTGIYEIVEGTRPTQTKWWREQIRRTVRRYTKDFEALGGGVYSLASAA